MFGWLTGYATLGRSSRRIYARIVADARRPELFATCDIPDTMDGRLESILLHLVLVLDRLKAEGPAAQPLGQRLIEVMVADLDDAFRQIGLGDDSVAHRLPRIAGALAERTRDYASAFSLPAPDASDALARALDEHVFRITPGSARDLPSEAAHLLAGYVLAARQSLSAASFRAVAEGTWPAPGIAQSHRGTPP